MDLELRHMELVCSIHEAGSLSRAARQLGVSQPALTAALHRIERAAGGRLFERSRQGIAPTDLGQFLLSRARPLIHEVKELTTAVRQRAEKGERRLLRIVITPGPYLGGFLTSLEELDRELSAQVDYGITDHMEKLSTGRLDAAVIGYAPEIQLSLPPSLRARHLVDSEPCWIAMSENHRLAARRDVELSELAKEDWITPPGGDHDGTTALFEAACRAAGFAPRIRYRLDDVSAATQLLASTQALIIAQPTCRRTAGLVVRPLRGHPILFRVTFLWRTSALSDPDADEIFRLLVSAYSAVIGTNDPYPQWWDENPWAHMDPAWATFQATSSS